MSIAINKWVRSVFRVLLLIDLCRAELGVARRWQVKHPTSYSVMSVTMISNYCISQQASLTWVTRVPCECMGTSCTDRHGSYATCPCSNHAWQWPYRDYGVHLLSDHLVTRDTCELCIKKAVVRKQEYLPTEQTSWFLNRKVTEVFIISDILLSIYLNKMCIEWTRLKELCFLIIPHLSSVFFYNINAGYKARFLILWSCEFNTQPSDFYSSWLDEKNIYGCKCQDLFIS